MVRSSRALLVIGLALGCTPRSPFADDLADRNNRSDGSSGDGALAVCGNGVVEAGEACDGNELGGKTCVAIGFASGALACKPDCSAFEVGGCQSRLAGCGNGVVEGYELCDGSSWAKGPACSDFGLGRGLALCTADCRIDFGGCAAQDLCLGLHRYGDGACDPCELLGGIPDPDCEELCGAEGTCADAFDPYARVWSCQNAGTSDPDCHCGDGVAVPPEMCDGTDVGRTTCGAYGYDGGVLACRADCALEFSGCSFDRCGDGVRGSTEACDGRDLHGLDCTAFAYDGGVLACETGCHGFDTRGCTTAAVCGDGSPSGPEVCDGVDLAGASCESLGYQRGTLGCAADCRAFDVGACTGRSTCGNGVVDALEPCDGTLFGSYGPACADLGLGPGLVRCTPACALDVSGCAATDVCKVFGKYGNGICDACELLGGTADPECASGCGANGACADNYDPMTGVWTCRHTGVADPDCGRCGNGLLEGKELCDGPSFGTRTCESSGYAAGALACRPDCAPSFVGCSR